VTTKRILALLALAALAGLSSCGGGGERPNPNATPTPTPTPLPNVQANLTSANAPTFARFADLAVRAALATRLGETLFPVANMLSNNLQHLACGPMGPIGATPAALLVVNSTNFGNVTGNASLTNFDGCYDMRLNGNASVSGTLGLLRVDTLTLTFTNLSYASSAGTAQLSGTLVVDWLSVPPDSRSVVTLNATASGADRFALSDFRVDSVPVLTPPSRGPENVLVSGRLTTSDGFVDIIPGPTRIELPLSATGLQGGSVIMIGAATIANVTYNGALAPTITITPK
jgi:hypothetical protein